MMDRPMRTLLVSLVAAVALSACDGVSGVWLAATWRTSVPVDALEVTTAVADGVPTSEVISSRAGTPLAAPYRLLVRSPANQELSVQLTAQSSGRAVARARIEVTPKERDVPEITVELQPIAETP
jgi:hypothetical protein